MSFKIIVKHSWNRLRFYLSFLLLAFYLFIGTLFLFTNTWIDLLPQGRIIIGITLILFGLLRFYVAYRRYIKKMIRIKSSVKIKENVATE
jgi:hypothetical protein